MVTISYEILGFSHDIEQVREAVRKRLGDLRKSETLKNTRRLNEIDALEKRSGE